MPSQNANAFPRYTPGQVDTEKPFVECGECGHRDEACARATPFGSGFYSWPEQCSRCGGDDITLHFAVSPPPALSGVVVGDVGMFGDGAIGKA